MLLKWLMAKSKMHIVFAHAISSKINKTENAWPVIIFCHSCNYHCGINITASATSLFSQDPLHITAKKHLLF